MANDVSVKEQSPVISDPGHQNKEQNCFICWRKDELEPLYFKSNYHRRERLHPSRKRSKAEATNEGALPSSFGSDNKEALALSSQLSVIFLLRKILGIRQDVLTKLLEKCGGDGPSGWGIKLCGGCHVLFREAEFVHRRLIKIQADFEYLAKEMREILLDSLPEVTRVPSEGVGFADDALNEDIIPVKRRRRGRPASKKKKLTTGLLVAEEMLVGGKENVVDILRKKFVEGSNSISLDISPPKILFTCHNDGGPRTILDRIQTSQPIQVKVKVTAQDFLKASGGVATISLDKSVRIPPSPQDSSNSKKSRLPISTPTSHEEAAPKLSPQLPGPSQRSAEVASAPVIKRELFLETNHDNLDNDEQTDYFDDIGMPPSPPPLMSEGEEDDVDPDPEWADENGYDDNESANEMAEEAEENDSDYKPRHSKAQGKKKDKRFTRKRPNVKINERKKELRTIKADSMGKVPAGATVEPVRDENDQIFHCPHEGCGLGFVKKFDCHVHVLKDHFEDPMPYQCHVCDSKRFMKEGIFRKHMNRFHQGANNPYEDGYDPELHSEAKLKSLVSQEEVWQSFVTARDSEHSSDDEGVRGVPTIPEEILEKFKISKDSEYPCSFPRCKKKYYNEMLRDAHEKRVHQGIEKPFSCDQCHRTFLRRTRLLQHLAVVHFSNQHACNQCGARFVDKVLLAGHIRRAHLGEKYAFRCTECRQQFIRRTKMDMHMFKKHGIPLPKKTSKRKIPAREIPIPKLYPEKMKKVLEGEEAAPVVPKKCWLCASEDGKPMLFDTAEDLKEHNEKNHIKPGIEKPFKCPLRQCIREYRTHGTLDFHIMNIHNGQILEYVPGKYKCFHCELDFQTSGNLDAHMARVHDVSMYICNYCAKKFRTQRYLDDHQRSNHYKEMNIEPFKCKFCGKILNTQKTLDHHITIVHKKASAFKCTIPGCSFGTMYESAMKVHHQIKHSNRKNAICPVCSRTFAAQFYLNRHMLIHSGEKPYKCSECTKDFSDLSTFNRHKEAHLGNVHKCPLESCGKEYNTRHAFRIHLKQHQAKGINVEIPKIRYQTKEEDERGQRLLEENVLEGEEGNVDENRMETKPVTTEDPDPLADDSNDNDFSDGLPILEVEEDGNNGCSNNSLKSETLS